MKTIRQAFGTIILIPYMIVIGLLIIGHAIALAGTKESVIFLVSAILIGYLYYIVVKMVIHILPGGRIIKKRQKIYPVRSMLIAGLAILLIVGQVFYFLHNATIDSSLLTNGLHLLKDGFLSICSYGNKWWIYLLLAATVSIFFGERKRIYGTTIFWMAAVLVFFVTGILGSLESEAIVFILICSMVLLILFPIHMYADIKCRDDVLPQMAPGKKQHSKKRNKKKKDKKNSGKNNNGQNKKTTGQDVRKDDLKDRRSDSYGQDKVNSEEQSKPERKPQKEPKVEPKREAKYESTYEPKKESGREATGVVSNNIAANKPISISATQPEETDEVDQISRQLEQLADAEARKYENNQRIQR